jgi:Glucose-6-phosphate dehydrogenase, NAD binding domain
MESTIQDQDQLNTAADLDGQGQPASPCVMVIFGASGDLTKRKLFPALCNLPQNRLLAPQFAVIAVLDTWKTLSSKTLPNYAAGSWGLEEADTLLARDGRASRAIEEERLSSETSEVLAAVGKATAHVP